MWGESYLFVKQYLTRMTTLDRLPARSPHTAHRSPRRYLLAIRVHVRVVRRPLGNGTESRCCDRLRANPAAQSEGLAGLTPLLNDARGAVRKRTIRALGNLIACSGDKVLSNLIDNEITPSLEKSPTEQLKTTISLCSTLTA